MSTPPLTTPRNPRRVTFTACTQIKPATTRFLTAPYRQIAAINLCADERKLDVNGEHYVPVMKRPPEALSRRNARPLATEYQGYIHQFIAAVNLAFDQHYPLTLSPDIVWLLILQGVAHHVKANSERLRGKFVEFKGKKELVILRDHFIKGSPDNDWEGAFAEFSLKIGGFIGKRRHSQLVPRFSTTGAVEQAAMEIALMDVAQKYFDYTIFTRCGIPSFTLEGTIADWQEIERRVATLDELDMGWWTRHLTPFVRQFVRASADKPDLDFWRAFYKEEGASGGPEIIGNCIALFPYVEREIGSSAVPGQYVRNELLLEKTPLYLTRETKDGASLSEMARPDVLRLNRLPGGFSRVPFLWKYCGRNINMEFLSGFVGVAQEPETLSLRPQIGWAVRGR